MRVISLSEYKKTIQKLLDSKVSGYQIHQSTGISQGRISDLRRGARKLGGITLDTAEKLYKYQKEIEEETKMIKWTGKTTSGVHTYKAEGKNYKELYHNIVDKYGYDFLDADVYEIQLLKKNNEDLERYDIDSEGIGNWEKYEEFESGNIEYLEDEDYRELIENSKGNAYHQEFEEVE